MRRIDDLRQIAEAPAFLLMPASLPYTATPLDVVSGFALYTAPRPELHTLRLAQHEPVSLSWGAYPSRHIEVTEVEFPRQTLGCRQRLLRYSRRQEARRHGRRRAVPVPIATEWEVRVFAQRGTDEVVLERMARRYAVVVARSWRHGDAAQWARRDYNLRVKRERRMVKP